jgi:hypothetical protein
VLIFFFRKFKKPIFIFLSGVQLQAEHCLVKVTCTLKNKLSHGANPASDKFLSGADEFIYLQQINFICSIERHGLIFICCR